MWLAAASTASATASGCNETQRGCACMTGECRFARSIAADEGAWIFCLHNPPLSPLHATGSALFAFVEAEITYSGKAEVHKASEDTEFLDLTRTASAEARAREWCRHLEEVKSSWSSLLPSWSADKRTDRYSFSPHYQSCLAVCPRGEAADVQVSFRRRSPFERDRARRPSAYESGAAALLVGLLLLASAGYLARSTAFHYGFGIGAWMALGVALVAVLLIQRTTSGRKGTLSAAAFLGWGGLLLRWGKDYLLSLWTSYSKWVLAYLGVFGVVGYAWTFWQLRGGRLEPWKAGLLERLLRLGACGLLLCAFHSARVCLAVILIALAVKFAPTGLGSSLQPWLAREVPPAPPPPAYRDRYLTEEEYRLQGQLTTDRELQALFASPEGRRWLTAAAGDGRLRVGPREGSGGGDGGGGDSSDEDD